MFFKNNDNDLLEILDKTKNNKKENKKPLKMINPKEHNLKSYKQFLNNKNKEKEKKELLNNIEKSYNEKKERLKEIEKVKQELLKKHKPIIINNKIKKTNIHENIQEKKEQTKKQNYFDKLINCKSCGNKVNALADKCPKCGWKVISNQKTIQEFFGIIMIGSFLYWLYTGGFLYLFKIAFLSNFN
jgi:predicted RNA-binding Zn-ribbon protein involved in translation (DUF1610 family)